MDIDAEKIIQETIGVFARSGAVNFYKKCENLIGAEGYKDLHPNFLTPLDIKIDCELFNSEVQQYEKYFEQWGNDHQQLPRYGLALVNQDGLLKVNDPTNGSLMAWNRDNPTHPLIETDCVTPTEVLKISSLAPLNMFNDHWCRSNILKWHAGALFHPHIDTIVPSMWIRLWASTSPDVVVRFAQNNKLVEAEFEVGRVYICDTSLVHDAYATGNNVHQLFLSVLPSAKNLLLQHTAN